MGIEGDIRASGQGVSCASPSLCDCSPPPPVIRLKNAKNRRFFFCRLTLIQRLPVIPVLLLILIGSFFKSHFRSPVRLAYDNFDANAAGKDLPPLMILHGLFGSKRNFRELAKMFNKETGRQVNYYFVECIGYEEVRSVIG